MKGGILVIVAVILFALLSGCSAEYVQRNSPEEREVIIIVEPVPYPVPVPEPPVYYEPPPYNPPTVVRKPPGKKEPPAVGDRDRDDRKRSVSDSSKNLRNSGDRNSKNRR